MIGGTAAGDTIPAAAKLLIMASWLSRAEDIEESDEYGGADCSINEDWLEPAVLLKLNPLPLPMLAAWGRRCC